MSEIDNKGKEEWKETPAAQAAGSKATDEEDKKQEDEPEGIALDSEEVGKYINQCLSDLTDEYLVTTTDISKWL
jgi:hypothetical protein